MRWRSVHLRPADERGTALRTRTLAILFLAGTAMLVSGCQPVTLTVTHVLPAATPLPPGGVRVGTFQVPSDPQSDVAALISGLLEEHLPLALGPEAGGADEVPAAEVAGTVTITVKDVRAHRNVRRWDPETKKMAPARLATLDRTVSVNVDFVVRDLGTDGRPWAVEQTKTYRSAADPRVWGELGLLRPDDPARIPPTETIVQELLGECVDGFCGMVAPMKVTHTIQLRSAPGLDAGVRAAGTGDLEAAEGHFRSALADRPNDAHALFNLGAVLEARGRLDAAVAAYEKAGSLSAGADAEAKTAAERLQRIRVRIEKAHAAK